MKNTIKLFGVLLIVFGVFVTLGTVSASSVDELQPANNVIPGNAIYTDAAHYEGGLHVDSVTFFNGTIINATTVPASASGEAPYNNPVTIGDSVRIDDIMYGGIDPGTGDGLPLKIADTLRSESVLNDIGTDSGRFGDGFFAGTIFSDAVSSKKLVLLPEGDATDIVIDINHNHEGDSEFKVLNNGSITANSYSYNSSQTRWWSIPGLALDTEVSAL